jgi:hypothetical protein
MAYPRWLEKDPVEVEYQKLDKTSLLSESKYGERYEKIEKELEKKFSPDEIKNWSFLTQLVNTVSASWECRDCMILDDEEYFKKQEVKDGNHRNKTG